jgi:hypothetical protein
VLYPCKRPCRGAPAHHLLVFGWLVVALIRAPGQGTRKGLKPYLPATLPYGTTVRMVRLTPWDAPAVLTQRAMAPRRTLPPPAAGVLSRLGESTLPAKRGRQHPLGYTTRQRESALDTFGVGLVLLVARWDRCRLPVALGLLDPSLRGHHNRLCRERLQAFVPPAWPRTRVVVAEAGVAAHATMRCSTEHHDGDVCAMPRTRQLPHGQHRRDLVPHLPKRCDQRRASDQPDGRRKDSWVFARRATRHQLGDVTLVLSKPRRHHGPNSVQILVTHRPEAPGGTIRSIYARRWGMERTCKALTSGLHLGDMQVTKDPERVARSVTWSVLASRLLVRLYGHDQGLSKEWSLLKLQTRVAEEVAQEAVIRTDLTWQRKLKRFKHVASCPYDNPSLLSLKG